MNPFIGPPGNELKKMLAGLNGDCIRFNNQALPAGFSPTHGAIGFEPNAANGMVRVLLQSGVQYSGKTASLRRWSEDGFLNFRDAAAVIQWLHDDVAPAMAAGATALRSQSVASVPPDSPPTITDTRQVTERIENENEALYINEDRIFDLLTESVKGQDNALKVLSSAMSRHIARCEPRRPLTVFAVGPTGVGKTKTGLCTTTVLNQLEGIRKGQWRSKIGVGVAIGLGRYRKNVGWDSETRKWLCTRIVTMLEKLGSEV